jgi:MoaA/NifB/PqqE/SkfB family radical SAM enzyme
MQKMYLKSFKSTLGKVKRSMARSFEKTLGQISPSLLLSLYPLKSMVIELTNICNLHCPLCPTPLSKRKKGIMSFTEFVKIAQSLPPSVKDLSIYLSGEPLLNKDLFRIINFIVNEGIYCTISTNGTLLNENIVKILDSGLSKLIIGVDGATENTYKKYRVGGNFNLIIESIQRLVEEKTKRNLENPLIELQFIVMKHTEKELDMIVKLANDLKVDALSLISVSLGTHRTNKSERKKLASEYLPEDLRFSRYDIDNTGQPINKWQYNYCPHWKSGVILWNGDITVCCFDHNGLQVYGNVLEEDFMKIWKSKLHYEVIKKILFRKMEICKTCNISSGDENRHIKLSH